MADEQLQHSLTVEEATPAGRGHRATGLGLWGKGLWGKGRVCRARARDGGEVRGRGGPGMGQGSLFDEVLHLLSAQECVLPLGHSPDQAQLLLAVTQGHSLNPARCTRVRTKAGLPHTPSRSPLPHQGREGRGALGCWITFLPGH